MACIRKRRGKYVVDYRDALGVRRWATCETRREAEAVLVKKVQERHQGVRVDATTTLREYADRWLGVIASTVKPSTLERYRQSLAYILPTFGAAKLSKIKRSHVKEFLAEKLGSEQLSRDSVRLLHATLRAMFNAAVEDELRPDNPAAKLGKQLRLVLPPKARQEAIKSLTREQLSTFLETASSVEPAYAPLLMTLARTGLRLGEVLGLQWQDVDLQGRELRVARALSRGRVDTPKSGHGRTVDMSEQLCDELRRLDVLRKADKLRQGRRELPEWIFRTAEGTPLDRFRVEKAFKRVLKVAGLPPYFSPHCLRHTFASLLLQAGVSPAYVQRQLGHASIQLTVDTYGRWLPMGNKAAVDTLDGGATGSKVVADATGTTADRRLTH